LGMTAAVLAGSLVAGTTRSQAPDTSSGIQLARRRFEGRVVLITGATSGIWRAAVLQFGSEGGKVSFCGCREKLGGLKRTQLDEQLTKEAEFTT
jgi:hypothetical protein